MTNILKSFFVLRKFLFAHKSNKNRCNNMYTKAASKELEKQLILKIKSEDYTKNHLQHYHFNIDNQLYIFGIAEIYHLIDKANATKFDFS